MQYGNKNTVRADRSMAEFVTTKELTLFIRCQLIDILFLRFLCSFTQLKSDIHPDSTLPTVLEIPITDTKKAASSVLIPSLELGNVRAMRSLFKS